MPVNSDASDPFLLALLDLLAWDEAAQQDKGHDLKAMAAALHDPLTREFLGFLGNSLVKAEAVVYCYFSFRQLDVGTLHSRKEVLVGDTLWSLKCDELIQRIPGLKEHITGGQSNKLQLIRALFGAIAAHHKIDKAGSCMVRTIFAEQTHRHELHGWMGPKQVLRAFCPSHHLTQQPDGRWTLTGFTVDCFIGDEHVIQDLGELSESKEKDTDVRLYAIEQIFHRFLCEKENLELKSTQLDKEFECAVRDGDGRVRAVVRNTDLALAQQEVITEYMRQRALELAETRSDKNRKEKNLAKKKEKEARELTENEKSQLKYQLYRRFKETIRKLERVLGKEPAPDDGFIDFKLLVKHLQEIFGGRYAPFVHDDLRDILENHDPLQRYGTEQRTEGLFVRANYLPDVPGDLKKLFPKCYEIILRHLGSRQDNFDLRAVLSSVEGRRCLQIMGSLPMDEDEKQQLRAVLPPHFFDASYLDTEFRLCDHTLVHLLPEVAYFSMGSNAWRRALRDPLAGLFYNFVILPEGVHARQEEYEAHPPEGVAYTTSGGSHDHVKLNLHRMVNDGWRIRKSIRPEFNGSLLLRPSDNLHRLFSAEQDPKKADVKINLLDYVVEIKVNREWVPFEKPADSEIQLREVDAISSECTSTGKSAIEEEEEEQEQAFRLDAQMQAIEEYADSRCQEPLRIALPPLLQPQRKSQVDALERHARQYNLNATVSDDRLWLILTHAGPSLDELREILGIKDFHHDRELNNALRHSSMNSQLALFEAPKETKDDGDGDKENKFRGAGGTDYERQEFLGDAVMDVCLAYDMYWYWVAGKKEQDRSTICSHFSPTVKNATLFQVMKAMGIMDRNFIQSNTKLEEDQHVKIFADVFEALVGALYLGKGLSYAHHHFRRWMSKADDGKRTNFYAWPEWLALEKGISPFQTQVLMPEDDFHKPRRYGHSTTSWTIDSIMVATEFPKMTHKDFKQDYSTHFKFADVQSSYRRAYNPELLYDRILLAFRSGVVGYTNETITNKTRFCIDVDGISTQIVLLQHETIEQFLQRRLHDLFPDVDTYCLVLDCSKPPKKYSQHMHWPNLFMDRHIAMDRVRRLQLEAISIVMAERAALMQLPNCQGNQLPRFEVTEGTGLAVGLSARLEHLLVHLENPSYELHPLSNAGPPGEEILRLLLKWADMADATFTRSSTGSLKVVHAASELEIDACPHNLNALSDWLFKDVENEDKLKPFASLLDKCWDHYSVETAHQSFAQLDVANRQGLLFLWLKYLDSFRWSKYLDMGVFRSRKLRMYMADKYDDKTTLSAGRPVTQARILPSYGSKAQPWVHLPTKAWEQQSPDVPFIHDDANPAPLTHRACLRLSSLRNPAHWQENAICQGDQQHTTEMYCDEKYAQFAWQFQKVEKPSACIPEKENEEKRSSDADESSSNASNDLFEGLENATPMQELQKIDKLKPNSLEYVMYKEDTFQGQVYVCEIWATNCDELLASYRSSTNKKIKDFAALEALKILRPRLAAWLSKKWKNSSDGSKSTDSARPAQPNQKPKQKKAKVVEVSPWTLQVITEVHKAKVKLAFIPRGAQRLKFLQELSQSQRVLWIFDDGERVHVGLCYTDIPGTLQFNTYCHNQPKAQYETDPFHWLQAPSGGSFAWTVLHRDTILDPPQPFSSNNNQLVVFDDCLTEEAKKSCERFLSVNLHCLVLSDELPPSLPLCNAPWPALQFCVPPHLQYPNFTALENCRRAISRLHPELTKIFLHFLDRMDHLISECLAQMMYMAHPPHQPLPPDGLPKLGCSVLAHRGQCQQWLAALGNCPTPPVAALANLCQRLLQTLKFGMPHGWQEVEKAFLDSKPLLTTTCPSFEQSLLKQLQELDWCILALSRYPSRAPEDVMHSVFNVVTHFLQRMDPQGNVAVLLPPDRVGRVEELLLSTKAQCPVRKKFKCLGSRASDLGRQPPTSQVLCCAHDLVRYLPPQRLIIVLGFTDILNPEQFLYRVLNLASPETWVHFLCGSAQEHWLTQKMLLDYCGHMGDMA